VRSRQRINRRGKDQFRAAIGEYNTFTVLLRYAVQFYGSKLPTIYIPHITGKVLRPLHYAILLCRATTPVTIPLQSLAYLNTYAFQSNSNFL